MHLLFHGIRLCTGILMKTLLILLFSVLLIFSSCEIDNAGRIMDISELNASVSSAIEYAGENPNVVGGALVPRFIDGQLVNMYVHEMGDRCNVLFSSYLVEYDSINPSLTQYVEEQGVENALFHHEYNVEMKEDKKYVEFAIYSDIETGIPLIYELRIGYYPGERFDGSWYAKSREFNSSFTYDYQSGETIDLGYVSDSESDKERTRFTSRSVFLPEGIDDSIAFTLDVTALEECNLHAYWKGKEAVSEVPAGESKYALVDFYDIQKENLSKDGQFIFLLEKDGAILDSFIVNPHTDSGLVILIRKGEMEIPEGYEMLDAIAVPEEPGEGV